MQLLEPTIDTQSIAQATAQGITYRWLNVDEYPQLAPYFAEHDAPLPRPELSQVYAAFEGDKLIAFWVLQGVLHAEPLYITPEHRGNGKLLVSLMQGIEPYVRNETVMVLAETIEVEVMCERLGLVRLPYPAYLKVKE